MKKKLLYMTAGFVVLISILAACGGGTEEQNAGEDETNQGDSPRTYTDSLDREVEIPERPEDIVTINYFGEARALGITPVGALDYDLNKYDEDVTEGIKSVGSEQADAEKIISLDPDLIIVSDYREAEAIESFQKIAPTVALPFGAAPLDQLETVAELTGREEEKEEWMEQYEADVEEAREEIAPYVEDGETAVVMQFYEKNIHMYSTETFPTIYNAAQFEPTEKAAEITEPATLSEEVIPEYSADRIFVMFADTTAEENFEELSEKSIWSGLPAVQNGKVHVVDNDYWSDFNATFMEWQLDDLVEKVKE
ncbi:ABC transporter substrate-binding protein [Salibacterium salarium]|uniref:ABC transporter substrate-binding protein n=1 Tax=Salibacterium salarium TaxID=284579 RepID=A0A3R9QGZ6_9BACI|nr:ABC transporter substrate-binding protein [Salibacterium salarium]RSL30292.1 ABC transporter substrate-binding protein [Salibacterium salarium]